MHAGEQVTSGTIDVKVKVSIFTIINEQLKLCDALKQTNRTCPIGPQDNIDVAVTQDIPKSPISVC